MKIAKKLKGMSVMAMAAITLTAAVASCSKDKGATPAQKTTETKKGLGMKVSAVSDQGSVVVTVSGYKVAEHLNAKFEYKENTANTIIVVDGTNVADGDCTFTIQPYDNSKSYSARISYDVPASGNPLVKKYTEWIDLKKKVAKITSVTLGKATTDGTVKLNLIGTDLKNLTIADITVKSKLKSNNGGNFADVSSASLNLESEPLDGDKRVITISGFASGEQYILNLNNNDIEASAFGQFSALSLVDKTN